MSYRLDRRTIAGLGLVLLLAAAAPAAAGSTARAAGGEDGSPAVASAGREVGWIGAWWAGLVALVSGEPAAPAEAAGEGPGSETDRGPSMDPNG